MNFETDEIFCVLRSVVEEHGGVIQYTLPKFRKYPFRVVVPKRELDKRGGKNRWAKALDSRLNELLTEEQKNRILNYVVEN